MKFIKVFIFAFIFAFFFVLPPASHSQNFSEDYHSLRPAPFSPYDDEVTGAILCGNTVYVSDSITKRSCCPADTCCTCNYHENRSGNVTIDFTNSELPIVGNTEDVANWDIPTDTLSDVEKVNQYVSWYLNGSINRAEYPFLSWKDKEDIKKIINFSGPIRKLLPQRIQDDTREKQVADASTNIRHNQIVACTYGINIPIPFLNLQIGAIPGPCRELGWLGYLIQKKRKISDWKNNLPPKREVYPNYREYYIDYRAWRGDKCYSVPFAGFHIMLCFDNPLDPNFYGDLYPYIPFTSTEDRVGMAKKEVPTEINLGNLVLTNIVYDAKDLKLYYAHMQETLELSDLLKKSFVPKEGAGGEGKTTPVAIGTGCQILDIRTNPGDHLVNPGWSINKKAITGDLSYTADFSCSFCGPKGTCTVKPVIPISLSTQNPLHDELWHNLVEGADSIFRRIFPKVGQGTSLDDLKDIPGTTTFKASSNRYTITTGGEIYFPHLGGISEYFLKGIQTMLRPKGYGEAISFGAVSGDGDGQCVPGEGSVDTAIADAASKYGIPAGLLHAIFQIEGVEYIADPEHYVCEENKEARAAGVMQITPGAYQLVTCENERMDNNLAACSEPGKLSRCVIHDAFELAARVLLSRVGLWSYSDCKPLGMFPNNKQDIYNAACRYYGSFSPDAWTIHAAQQFGLPDPSNKNYCDVVCFLMGLCPPFPSH